MRKWRIQSYILPEIDRREVFRYAGVKGEPSEQLETLLTDCIQECEEQLSPRVVACVLTREELAVHIEGAAQSQGLQRALGEAKEVLLFAATIGLALDRAILRAAATKPSKALLLQAFGAERIEALCEDFCERFAKGATRFSAGYGDFPLIAQRSIFQLLDAPREIGLTLTEGYIMSPTKSVTAIVPLHERTACKRGCDTCTKEDCEYRQ